METDKIILYAIIGVLVVTVLCILVIKIVKFAKMSKEERVEVLKTYLKGIIALAEQEIIGTKRGQEKLQMVEDYFNKKAPKIYKFILLLIGKDNLKELIETSLQEIKDNFSNNKK